MNPTASRKASVAPKPPAIPPIAVSVDEAARAIGLGRTKLYALMKTGEIVPIRLGGRTLIPVAALHGLVQSRSVAA